MANLKYNKNEAAEFDYCPRPYTQAALDFESEKFKDLSDSADVEALAEEIINEIETLQGKTAVQNKQLKPKTEIYNVTQKAIKRLNDLKVQDSYQDEYYPTKYIQNTSKMARKLAFRAKSPLLAKVEEQNGNTN